MSRKRKKARLYSALEIANMCGVVNQTAINWIRKGTIKAFMTPGGQYRVYPNDLARFLVENNMRVPDELAEYIQSSENATQASIVLLTDNDELFQNINSFIKKKREIDLYKVANPKQAMRAISTYNPSVVLTDSSSISDEVMELLAEYIEQLHSFEVLTNCELVLFTNVEELPTVIEQRYNVA